MLNFRIRQRLPISKHFQLSTGQKAKFGSGLKKHKEKIARRMAAKLDIRCTTNWLKTNGN